LAVKRMLVLFCFNPINMYIGLLFLSNSLSFPVKIFLLLLISVFRLNAQSTRAIDSLVKLLGTDNDTNYVNHCLKIGNKYSTINIDSCHLYINLAIKKSEDKNLPKKLVSALTTSGNLYNLHGNFDKALEHFSRVLKMEEEAKNKLGIGNACALFGNTYNCKADLGNAKKYHTRSLSVMKEINDKGGIAMALGNLGIAFSYAGNYPEALKHYLSSLSIMEEMGSARQYIGIYNAIGTIYFLQENYKQAEKYFDKSLGSSKQIKSKSGMATALYNLALIYSEYNENEKAVACMKKALTFYEEEKGKQGVADCYKALGSILGTMEKNEESREYFAKALKVLSELEDKVGLAETYNNLGDIYFNEKNYNEALNHFMKGLRLAREVNYLAITKQSIEKVARAYKAKGDTKNALVYFEEFVKLKDSLLNKESIEKIATLKANYEADEREKSAAINRKVKEEVQKAELSKQKTLSIVFGVSGIIVLLMAVFALRGYFQKKKANTEISLQKKVIEEKNKNIVDSINYSKNIQEAILPSEKFFKRLLPDSFILYKPKDIVSGDFYFVGSPVTNLGDKLVVFGVADCTGHGVPGAFLTLLGKTFIQLGLTDKSVNSSADALDYLNRGITEILNKKSSDGKMVRDGMDISLCSMNYESMSLGFSGAKNGIYLIRDGIVTELKPDKHAIGELNDEKELPLYTNQNLTVKKGDTVYLFSDGYVDQFGGPQGKKYKSKTLREKLLNIHLLPMDEQKQILDKTFSEWKGNHEQVDDVCIVGVKI